MSRPRRSRIFSFTCAVFVGIVATLLHQWHRGYIDRQIGDAARFASTPEFVPDPARPSTHTFDLTGWPERNTFVGLDIEFENDSLPPGPPVPIETEIRMVDHDSEKPLVFEAAEPSEGGVQRFDDPVRQVHFLGRIHGSGPVGLELTLRPANPSLSIAHAQVRLEGAQDHELLEGLRLQEGFGEFVYFALLFVTVTYLFTLLFPSRRPTSVARERHAYGNPPPMP